MYGGASDLHRIRLRAIASDLNSPSGDNVPADEAVTLLIERLPLPEMIEPAKQVELPIDS